MTLKRLLLLIINCSVIGAFSAQTTNAFRVNYDLALFDLPGNAIEGLTPSTYLFAGTNVNFLPIYGTVTQIDNIGALVWSKRYYDGSLGFQLNDIKKDVAGNEYYLCGGSESNAGVFMRLNAAGNVVVSKKFSINEADAAYFNRVIKTSDGGYVAVGYVTGYDPDGAGPEIDFVPINYVDNNGDPQTDRISSPLIVKLDANGNHLWHKVFRYYTAATKNPATERIYNDASFNDVVETADGYIAVGQYDVNQHRSATNSDGDDATPTDALVLKTNTAGTIIYHKQYDLVSSSTTQNSKYLTAINKTSVGDPIAAGSDNGREWIIKFTPTGGFTSTFSRLFQYSNFFGTTDPVDVSQIYEVNGGTDLVTMGMYIKPFNFVFSNSIHRVNSAATTNTWAKYYTFSLATILPRGSQTSDNGFIMASTVMGGANFDYHLIKTDPTGTTPLTGCAPVSFTPSASAGVTTIADPHYNSWSGTVGSQVLSVLVANVSPTSSVQCSYVSCTPPSAPVIGAITQPTCTVSTGSVALSGLPASGTWTVTASPGGATITGTGTTGNFTGLAPNTYTFTVTLAGCTSVASSSAIINAAPTVPSAPIIGTITQPTCSVSTGSVALSGLPASGSWTVTTSPGGGTNTGTGTTTTISGLTAATTYTFTVTNASGCTSVASSNAVINSIPTTPTAPIIATITQPTCTTATGSVSFSGLPASGSWTITSSPGSFTETNTGTTGTLSGLTAGTTYTFTVTNAGGCTSTASTNTVINTQPTTPSVPIIGAITQPTCTTPNGSVNLSGLPASGTWTVTSSPGALTATGTGSTTTFTGLSAGTTYTFTVTNASGCTSTASTNAVIDVVPGAPTAPTAGSVTQPTCSVPTGTIEVDSPLGVNYTYSINGVTFQASTTFSGLNQGNYTLTVLDNTSGCSTVASSSITIDPVAGAPVITLVSSNPVTCFGDTDGELEISVSGGQIPYTYIWTPNVGSGPIVSNLTAGSYSVTVTDDLGCSSTSNFTVASPNALANNGVSSNVICGISDGTITTSVSGGTGPYTYLWTPNGEMTSGLSGLAVGVYSVTVTDNNSCSATDNYTIATTGSLPILVDPTYALINAGESVQLTATGGDSYTWTPSQGLSCTTCPNPIASPITTTIYYVNAVDANGCTGVDTVLIEIKLACGELFIPNIFSPNGEGPEQNNKLCVFGNPSCVKELNFAIYNRWGEKVFETTDITICWDGFYKGKPMNSGIYVYKLNAVLMDASTIEVSGNTTLVR